MGVWEPAQTSNSAKGSNSMSILLDSERSQEDFTFLTYFPILILLVSGRENWVCEGLRLGGNQLYLFDYFRGAAVCDDTVGKG